MALTRGHQRLEHHPDVPRRTSRLDHVAPASLPRPPLQTGLSSVTMISLSFGT